MIELIFMALSVTKIGDDIYLAKSIGPSGAVEWQTEAPLTSRSLQELLVSKYGYSQTDILTALLVADPDRFEPLTGKSEIVRNAEEVLSGKQSESSRFLELRRLLQAWVSAAKK